MVCYVPAREAKFVTDAIEGYKLFTELVEQYVDEVIRQTRAEREREFPKRKASNKKQKKNEPKEKSPKKGNSTIL